MLTHGSTKMDRISEQMQSMMADKPFPISFNHSEDMKTWCQGFWP